ncbi:MAG: N-acetylmuramoyl-L-alanine amidase [Proteobacteria bacterium]|jgi:N-acetylmuramoyl-L-alanine amidase|nr:N-acetylmuramoyl-L-alanine amidase [Pseudomonadota bacterium]
MVFLSLILGFLGCSTPSAPLTPSRSPQPVEEAPAEPTPVVHTWPHKEASLNARDVTFPDDFGVYRLFVDPGHGSKGNVGNISVKCEEEKDFTMRIAERLVKDIENTGHFEVLLSRHPGTTVSYGERVKAAASFGAKAFISLHSDNRGEGSVASSVDGRDCIRRDGAEGFSVLYSDEGSAELASARHELAVAFGQQLLQSGFTAYRGEDYKDLYDEDPVHFGVFVDRHQPKQRILVLRRPVMPSVVIETHHSWHPEEVARWEEERTLSVFSSAVIAALVSVLHERGKALEPAL